MDFISKGMLKTDYVKEHGDKIQNGVCHSCKNIIGRDVTVVVRENPCVSGGRERDDFHFSSAQENH